MAILGELHHPHVLHMYGVTFHAPNAYIVMELCSSSLLGVMQASAGRAPPFVQRVHWVLQIAYGMQYLHARGVVHRWVGGSVLVGPLTDALCCS